MTSYLQDNLRGKSVIVLQKRKLRFRDIYYLIRSHAGLSNHSGVPATPSGTIALNQPELLAAGGAQKPYEEGTGGSQSLLLFYSVSPIGKLRVKGVTCHDVRSSQHHTAKRKKGVCCPVTPLGFSCRSGSRLLNLPELGGRLRATCLGRIPLLGDSH